jgi:hypothetical protein
MISAHISRAGVWHVGYVTSANTVRRDVQILLATTACSALVKMGLKYREIYVKTQVHVCC